MGCCDETTARVPDRSVSRRSLFKGAALVASVVPTARPTRAATQVKQIKLAYCSQLLCGVPYEVARSAGYFKDPETIDNLKTDTDLDSLRPRADFQKLLQGVQAKEVPKAN